MEFIRGIHNINDKHSGCVLTIGNFDGVHLGHKALLLKLCKAGKKLNLPVTVIIFEPQTFELLSKNRIPARLTCLREKLKYLSECNIDKILCIRFNYQFSQMPANVFIFDLLVNKLQVKYLLVGSDFKFGVGGKGDVCLLKKASKKYGFKVVVFNTLHKDKYRISSTVIRKMLAKDNLILAEYLLGHSFTISGKVIHGNKLGHMLGFPTANISLYGRILPIQGVYAVEVQGVTIKPILGIANIGIRPSIKDCNYLLEVHLFDININIYGKYIDVSIKYKIRDEKQFTSLETLKNQITKDVLIARNFFNLGCNISNNGI
ncbi:MAG: bifunctional riboflavin kinase/FAD synthetase [Pantoea sp. Brub]|nr:bifunctional riboflavin kinase/FAD synthetase [Pantoea sp. Brub]